MKYFNILAALLCVEASFGAPWTERRRQNREDRQLARRSSAGTHVSRPRMPANSPVDGRPVIKSNFEYSSNWAGAVLVGTGYTQVTGTITVPTIATSLESRTKSSGSVWVGIDGDTCETSILQTGIDWFVEGDTVNYSAWYEWYPDVVFDFSDIAISAGDSIKMIVIATSKTSGTAVLENLTTGVVVTEAFSGMVDGPLCQYDAEWVVEDFEACTDACSLMPFADFGTINFTDVSAIKSGTTVGLTNSTIIDIMQSDKVLTTCSETSSTLTCTHIG